jgi:hypothetical protein
MQCKIKKTQNRKNCLDVYVLLTITKSNLPVGSKMVMKKYAVIRKNFIFMAYRQHVNSYLTSYTLVEIYVYINISIK